MEVTLIYDNSVHTAGLLSDWGFSCLIQGEGIPKILFDTGANGDLLLHNMEKLDIDPRSIEIVFISHAHWDHIGGLSGFLEKNKNIRLYIPASYPQPPEGVDVIKVYEPAEIGEGIFTTGELSRIEQSLAIRTSKGLCVIAGCSHPGVKNILDSASRFGQVYALVGGLHDFNQFEAVEDLGLICPCHCTQHKEAIRSMYPQKFIQGGVGRIIETA